MYEGRWLQSGSSTVESRLLRVVLDRVATQSRHRWRTPATIVPGETAFRDLTDGRAPTALGRLIEDGVELLDQAAAAHRSCGRAAAARLRALAAFARHRPAGSFDRAPGELGAASAASRAARPAVLTDVGEWAVAEVATRLHLTEHAAAELLVLAVTLDEQLPATRTALAEGRIGETHAAVLADLLPLLTDPPVRASVEAGLLARVGAKTHSQLRVAARRAVLRADADAAVRRAAAAVRERGVRLYPGKDGLDSLSCALASPVARACYHALERYAEACQLEGDPRTQQQRMADCLADLILRPGATGLPPVQAQLTITAPAATLAGGDEPAEVDGEPLPAPVLRQIAHVLGLLPRPTGEAAAEPASGPKAEAPARAGVPADAPAVPDDDEARDACATARTVPAAGAAGTAAGGTPDRDDDRQPAAWPTCSSPTGSPAPRWPPAPRSPSPTRSPAPGSPSPTPPPSAAATPSAHQQRPSPTGRRLCTGSCAPATGAAASPAAAPDPARATWTTRSPTTVAAERRTAICAAYANTTTGSHTRHRGGP